jgi:hypothetical protein
LNDAEARQRRIDEENISTAELAGARPDAATAREAERARRGDIIDVQPEVRNVRAVEVPKTEVTAQAVSVRPAGGTAGTPASAPSATPSTSNEPERGPLFSAEEAANLRSRWDAIQVGFVDEPRRSVQEADSLVATAMKRLAEQFAAERSTLEGQWDRGSDVSTEDLRIALRHYRSFFGRLLSV